MTPYDVAELDVSEDELLRALRAVEPTQDHTQPGWFTVEELVGMTGLGVTTVRSRLRALVKDEVMNYKKVARTGLLGQRYWCNAFKLASHDQD